MAQKKETFPNEQRSVWMIRGRGLDGAILAEGILTARDAAELLAELQAAGFVGARIELDGMVPAPRGKAATYAALFVGVGE